METDIPPIVIAGPPEPREAPEAARIRRTARILLAMVGLGLLLVIGRVGQLKVAPPEGLDGRAPDIRSERREIARRGDLVDRRGRVLASSRIGARLFADPALLENPDDAIRTLAGALGVDADRLAARFEARSATRYAVLWSSLSDHQAETVRTLDLPGVGLEPVLVRHRPYDEIGEHLLGTVGFDHQGLSGLEHLFDDLLRPDPGRLRYLRDANRRAMWIETDGHVRGVDGRDLRLSLDIEIQRMARARLEAALEQWDAGGGQVVVVDPATGEILALVDVLRGRSGVPPFTSDPARGTRPGLGRLRAATDPYEPGSTFKPFVWAAATELGRARPEEVLEVHYGSMRIPKAGVVNDAWTGWDELTWEEVLAKSSNIGMAQVALRLDEEEMREIVRGFGFGYPTGCALPGESRGLVTPAKRWTTYTQTRVSFGHEISVTPLQLVRGFCAFARDGSLPMLTLLADPGGRRKPGRPWLLQQPIEPESARETRRVLHEVMRIGTGRRAREGARYRMFAKSGTAEMPDRVNGGYFEDRYILNFIAGAPLERPRIVVLGVVEDPDPERSKRAGEAVGPMVRDIVNDVLAYLGVPPDFDASGEPVVPDEADDPSIARR